MTMSENEKYEGVRVKWSRWPIIQDMPARAIRAEINGKRDEIALREAQIAGLEDALKIIESAEESGSDPLDALGAERKS